MLEEEEKSEEEETEKDREGDTEGDTEEDREEDSEEPQVKKRRSSFDLPDGFIVIKRKTKKNSWKEYQGPDGID